METSILQQSGLSSSGIQTLSGGYTQPTSTFGGGMGTTDILALASGANPYVAGANALADMLGIDLLGNLSNVFKYGIDSWGASTNPEKEQERIAFGMNNLQGLLSSMNDSNVEQNLNEIEFISCYYAKYYRASLSRRSWAGSTEEAFKLHAKAFEDFRTKVLNPLLSDLRAKGATITSATKTGAFADYEREMLPWQDPNNTTSEKNGNFIYTVYTVKLPIFASVDNGSVGGVTTTEAGGIGIMGLVIGAVVAKMLKLF